MRITRGQLVLYSTVKRKKVTENTREMVLTGLAVSLSCTSSTILLVERRRGNLDRVSSRDIWTSCSSSFLLSQINNATSTMMPTKCWFKSLISSKEHKPTTFFCQNKTIMKTKCNCDTESLTLTRLSKCELHYAILCPCIITEKRKTAIKKGNIQTDVSTIITSIT